MFIIKGYRLIALLSFILQGSLSAAATSVSSERFSTDIKELELRGQQNNFDDDFQNYVERVGERVAHLRALGEIENLNELRSRLIACRHDEAWRLFNIRGVGPNPSCIAKSKGYFASAELLENFNRTDDPLFQAIMFGDKQKIESTLAASPEKLNAPIFCQTSPISWAISIRDEELVEYFINKGAVIDRPASVGLSPYAESRDIPRLHQLMLLTPMGRKLRAQEDVFSDSANKAIASIQEYPELLTMPLGCTPIEFAAMRNNLKLFKFLFKKALDGPGRIDNERRLFLNACAFRAMGIIDFLARKNNRITLEQFPRFRKVKEYKLIFKKARAASISQAVEQDRTVCDEDGLLQEYDEQIGDVSRLLEYKTVLGSFPGFDRLQEILLKHGAKKALLEKTDLVRPGHIGNARGARFELEVAFNLYCAKKCIERFGATYDGKEFDIETPTTLYECKDIAWKIQPKKKLQTFLLEHKTIANNHGKKFKFYSRRSIPDKWKAWLSENGIKFRDTLDITSRESTQKYQYSFASSSSAASSSIN